MANNEFATMTLRAPIKKTESIKRKNKSWKKEIATLAKAAPKFKTSDATKRAYSRLNQLASDKAGWGKAIGTNIKRYAGMGNFDPKKSAYYQNAYNTLRQTMQNRGRLDMQDSIAAAAANTGGFGNSYGTTAGNRAYQARLQELAGQVPTLYAAANGELQNHKNNLASLIGMQQQQQQTALNNAQFMVNTQQALDESRNQAENARYNAIMNLAKLKLQHSLQV